jgi:hypothetical protein
MACADIVTQSAHLARPQAHAAKDLWCPVRRCRVPRRLHRSLPGGDCGARNGAGVGVPQGLLEGAQPLSLAAPVRCTACVALLACSVLHFTDRSPHTCATCQFQPSARLNYPGLHLCPAPTCAMNLGWSQTNVAQQTPGSISSCHHQPSIDRVPVLRAVWPDHNHRRRRLRHRAAHDPCGCAHKFPQVRRGSCTPDAGHDFGHWTC